MAFAGEIFHHEAELVVVIGRDLPLGHHVRPEDLAGMTLGLDLTRRDKQTQLKDKGLPWASAKSFCGSAVVAPLIPAVDFGAALTLEFALSINGEARQHGRTRDMLFSVEFVLNWLAKSHALRCGDVIFTGTPEGVGPIRVGDTFELKFLGGLSENVWRGTL
jgi:2-keto-4-pentenoate hydratase/2-oxohepta-3-ene-1,7-dioic acid hydratase in catechol pathway